jgi:hypothetical protein
MAAQNIQPMPAFEPRSDPTSTNVWWPIAAIRKFIKKNFIFFIFIYYFFSFYFF